MNFRLKPVLQILVYIIIFFYIYIIFFNRGLSQYLDENWNELKCNPIVIPVAGISSKPKGSNFFTKTVYNFNYCTSSYIQNILHILFKPIYDVFYGLLKGLEQTTDTLNKFRNMVAIIRNLFKDLVETTFTKISNSYATLLYFQEKLTLLHKKQSAIFEILSQFLTSLPFLFYSFTNGPIPRFAYWLSHYIGLLISLISVCLLCAFGGPFTKLFACPVCALCITPNSLVLMEDNTTRYIIDIEVGDTIKGGGKVTGILYMKPQIYEVYEVSGYKSSGSHMIYNNDKWCRIEEVYNDPKEEYTSLHCLFTEKHKIYVNDTILSDFIETNDNTVLASIHTEMLNSLNNSIIQNNKNLDHTYYWGFSENTNIYINGLIYNIKRLIDSKVLPKNIIGFVKINDPKIKWYEYKNIILSGNTIVYDIETKTYLRVYMCNSARHINYSGYLYNLISNNNTLYIKTNNEIVETKDFQESSDIKLNKHIDNLLLKSANMDNQ